MQKTNGNLIVLKIIFVDKISFSLFWILTCVFVLPSEIGFSSRAQFGTFPAVGWRFLPCKHSSKLERLHSCLTKIPDRIILKMAKMLMHGCLSSFTLFHNITNLASTWTSFVLLHDNFYERSCIVVSVRHKIVQFLSNFYQTVSWKTIFLTIFRTLLVLWDGDAIFFTPKVQALHSSWLRCSEDRIIVPTTGKWRSDYLETGGIFVILILSY